VVSVTDTWQVEPSGPLRGDISVRGSKNAVTKHMVAAMLGDGPSTIRNAPEVGDVDITAAMLEAVGFEVERRGPEITVAPGGAVQSRVPEAFTGLNRIPILMLGPLLHRTGEAFVPLVGGDPIGRRPVDFHVAALRALGAAVETGPAGISARAARLHGARIDLPYPSVGATENALFAAVLAEGTTLIRNAAVEPEVIDQVMLLQKMGAIIFVDTDRTLVIEGVDRLHGAEHTVINDRNEAASFAIAGIITGGDVLVEGAEQANMLTFLNKLRQVGAGFEFKPDGIRFFHPDRPLSPIALETDVHPGFMTDWQQPFVMLMTQAHGLSVVHETVYERRFGYTETLVQMGAEIQLFRQCLGEKACRFKSRDFPHSSIIKGPTPLYSADVTIPDLRAGFSYLIAAALAEGTSRIHGVQYVERGYSQILEKFQGLGANIELRVDDQSD
jgi:UDP-N-acetylglucosamine 1-carboxyvinyltransferase